MVVAILDKEKGMKTRANENEGMKRCKYSLKGKFLEIRKIGE